MQVTIENPLVLPNLPVEPRFCCSLYLICNHEMFRWSMRCCVACLGCTDCSRMCACLSVLRCWRWIVWCMHVSCTDSDVHSCFELWSVLSQSSWIRRYIRITYYCYYYLDFDFTPLLWTAWSNKETKPQQQPISLSLSLSLCSVCLCLSVCLSLPKWFHFMMHWNRPRKQYFTEETSRDTYMSPVDDLFCCWWYGTD